MRAPLRFLHVRAQALNHPFLRDDDVFAKHSAAAACRAGPAADSSAPRSEGVCVRAGVAAAVTRRRAQMVVTWPGARRGRP